MLTRHGRTASLEASAIAAALVKKKELVSGIGRRQRNGQAPPAGSAAARAEAAIRVPPLPSRPTTITTRECSQMIATDSLAAEQARVKFEAAGRIRELKDFDATGQPLPATCD